MRWNPTTPRFILAGALLNAALYHAPLYSFAVANLDLGTASGVLTLATVFVLAVAATALVFGLLALASERIVKPLFMVAALGNAAALYFMQAYGVVLDKAMMGNVLNTNVAETTELLHPKLLAYLLLLGALPCWLLTRVTVKPTPLPRRLAFVGLVLVATLGWGYANAKSWLWLDKNSKRLGGMTLPWNYAINGPRRLAELAKPREQKLLPPATATAPGKAVVMLLIGEAARAQDFSLYGYSRPTNPVMTKEGVVVLPHAHSCTTYTTGSLLCILSHLESGDAGWEPLTSYLQRSGVDVIWRSANSGEPPMKVATFQHIEALQAGCEGEGCQHDEVLLRGLAERIRASTQDRVFVTLHLGGSHGPAYNTKYPARFETFKPVCESVELSKCTPEALVNAYDNTIVYEDYVIGQAIELLRGFAPVPTMLMYLSDHGESLGEYGLYLHGTPWSIAPEFQKDIPFVVWMSDDFRKRKDIPAAQLATDAQHSQANVFHSVMGALDLRSEVYRPELDLFSPPADRR